MKLFLYLIIITNATWGGVCIGMGSTVLGIYNLMIALGATVFVEMVERRDRKAIKEAK